MNKQHNNATATDRDNAVGATRLFQQRLVPIVFKIPRNPLHLTF